MIASTNVTKGSFFHHFESKEDLALSAAARWEELGSASFAKAAYRDLADPLDRLLAYVDMRKSILSGELPEYTCFAGTVIQEVYGTHPEFGAACAKSVFGHAQTLEADIREAVRKYGVRSGWTVKSLALHTQAVLQGAFILAKANGGAGVAADSLDHLRRYLELLFGRRSQRESRRLGRGAGSLAASRK